jgi:hypothetical protein
MTTPKETSAGPFEEFDKNDQDKGGSLGEKETIQEGLR